MTLPQQPDNVWCVAFGTAPLYGHMLRTELEAAYTPLTRAQFAHARWQALRATTWHQHHDVVVETCEADNHLVHVLPADVSPYPWRTFWRKQEEEP